MEYLGGINLFTSHFTMGCREVEREHTKTETKEIEALHKWLDFKDNDWAMVKYRTDRTQYIDFLEIIELETFKELTEGLYQSYYKEFPYSTKKDFIKHVFDYTIYDLECFLKLGLYWLGEAPNEKNYSFYTVYSRDDSEFLDYAINSKFNIEHYKQYYKAVLEYLKSFHDEALLTLPNFKYQLGQNEVLTPQQTEKQKPEQEAPKTFDELFYNIELVQQSIDVLKEIEPPLIDTDYNYIGKLKGIICVWIDELQRQGIVKHYSDRKIFASLIPQKIKRFSIDESMFGKHHSKAEAKYRTDIKTKVSKIKLSQNSQ